MGGSNSRLDFSEFRRSSDKIVFASAIFWLVREKTDYPRVLRFSISKNMLSIIKVLIDWIVQGSSHRCSIEIKDPGVAVKFQINQVGFDR